MADRKELAYINAWDFAGINGSDFAFFGTLTRTKQGVVHLQLATNPSIGAPGQPAQIYSTLSDIWVRTSSFAPGAWLEWGFIQLFGETDVDDDDVDITTLDVRLFDGADPVYWSGAAWVVATDDDLHWNTLVDFNANLAAFTGTSIAIEVRLRTVDKEFTPTLSSICLKWKGKRISFYREWIVETVLGSLLNNLRPLTDYPINHTGGITVDLAVDHKLDASWVITDTCAVYDHDTDPDHLIDLFDSFDAVGGIVTLTGAVGAGTRLWLVLEYQPQVAITTSSDYFEGGRAPAVLLTLIDPRWSGKSIGARGPVIIDTTTSPPVGTVFPQPLNLVDIDFTFATVAPTSQDLIALNEAVANWLDAHPVIRSPNLDQTVKMYAGNALDWNTAQADVKDPRLASGTFFLRNVPVIGDPSSGAANADGSAGASKRLGPVDAGDPDAPGVGYGVERVNPTYRNVATGGEDTGAP